MSRNKPLSCQTTKHFVVIRKNKPINEEVLKKFLNEHYKHWAYIVHNNHEDKSTGEIIPIHYHYVGDYIKKKTPMSTTLNEIVKAFKFDNANGIEIDQYVSLEKSLQYLIHKNNPEKTPEKVDKIKFSGWSKEELTTYITSDVNGINFDRVLAVCQEYDNIIEVIKELGFYNYHKYRNTIRDIFEASMMMKQKKKRDEFIEQAIADRKAKQRK